MLHLWRAFGVSSAHRGLWLSHPGVCGRERHQGRWCYSTCERTQPFGGTSRAGCCRSACTAGCRNHYCWLSVLFRHVWQATSLAPRAPLRSPTRWRMRPTCGAFTWQVCLSFAAEAIASFTAPCHRQRDWNGVESRRTEAVCCRSMLYQAPPRVGYVRYVGRKRHCCAAIAWSSMLTVARYLFVAQATR
mgnify:CR=1 FL=1